MNTPTASRVWSIPVRVVGMSGLAAYAYWATGLRPFTVSCYAAVGIPVAVVTAALFTRHATELSGGRRRHRGQVLGLHGVVPWLVGALLAAGLEGLALGLGGRSSAVPTLSTVIDHALAWHVLRLVLFTAWLLIGSAPLLSVMRGSRRVG